MTAAGRADAGARRRAGRRAGALPAVPVKSASMASSSACGRTGLATKAFMPTARQRSRSLDIAWAVTATIGVD